MFSIVYYFNRNKEYILIVKNSPKISVVMPAYNVEKYIAEAIESIQNQTMTDWELIIVDDCSTDSTRTIVEHYAKADERIKLVCRKTNSNGAREPRHQAVMMAIGEFVCNIDSDDIIEPSYLQSLYDKQLETNVDGVTSRLRFYNNDFTQEYNYSIPSESFDMNQIITGIDACRRSMDKLKFSFSGYLCKTDIYKKYIKEDGILQINTGFADEIDARKIMLRLNKIAFCDVAYRYRQQPDSIVHDTSIKSFNKLEAHKMRLELAEKEFASEFDTILAAGQNYLENIYRTQILFYENRKKYSPQELIKIENIIGEAYNSLKQRNFHFKTIKQRILNSSRLIMKFIAQIVCLYSKIKSLKK